MEINTPVPNQSGYFTTYNAKALMSCFYYKISFIAHRNKAIKVICALKK
ncbi:hypothetical protein MED121_00510 [Marinomonas sp. MED121]|nr:hypothetical protein MED121_00510 [Marinomonas sp. MED121]